MGIFILIGGIIGFIGLCLIGWFFYLESYGEYNKASTFLDIGVALIVIWAIAMMVIIALSLFLY